ncbi:MAG TPA: TIGR03435 family protein [Terracidiphilus sp.]
MIEVEVCRRHAAWNLFLISASLAIIIAQGTSAAGLAPSPAAPSATTPQAAPAAAEPKQTTPTEPPKFEVSTVKASKPDPGNSMMMFTPDGISITSFRLDMVVREAFGINDDRIFGEPGWVKSDRFNIEAKVSADDTPRLKGLKIDERRAMVVQLLEDRFGLKFHHETRDLPMYNLVIAKSGIRMQPAKEQVPAQARHMLMAHGAGEIESTGASVQSFVRMLSAQLGRTVVDKTGLTGNYDYTLKWTPDDDAPAMARPDETAPSPNGGAEQNPSGPSLFTALEEQLGLKLESSKGPGDVIVIDHIELPTPN